MIRQGKLRAVRVGTRRLLIPKSAVIAFLEG